MNAVILIAVISVGNSAIFGSSRTLAALADQGQAPKILGYVDRRGRPLVAIIIASLVGLLGYLADIDRETDVLGWLLAISALSIILTWGSICLCVSNNLSFVQTPFTAVSRSPVIVLQKQSSFAPEPLHSRNNHPQRRNIQTADIINVV